MAHKPVILFLEYEGFCSTALSRLTCSFDVVFCTLEDLHQFKALEKIEGIFVRLKTFIDDSVLGYFPNLKFVISPTTGHSHLDLAALDRREIRLVSLKGEADFLKSVTATAELTWGLILSLTRRIPGALSHVLDGGWEREKYRGIDLAGRTLGIVGYGRLGKILEGYGSAFRMKVLIHDVVNFTPLHGCKVELSQLLEKSDIVTVHVDVNPSSIGMFDDKAFRLMKQSALFVNTSRGELVDEVALLSALDSGQIAAAALDVVRDEHTAISRSPLLDALDRLNGKLLVTPHIGGATIDSMAKTENFIVEKVLELRLNFASQW